MLDLLPDERKDGQPCSHDCLCCSRVLSVVGRKAVVGQFVTNHWIPEVQHSGGLDGWRLHELFSIAQIEEEGALGIEGEALGVLPHDVYARSGKLEDLSNKDQHTLGEAHQSDCDVWLWALQWMNAIVPFFHPQGDAHQWQQVDAADAQLRLVLDNTLVVDVHLRYRMKLSGRRSGSGRSGTGED